MVSMRGSCSIVRAPKTRVNPLPVDKTERMLLTTTASVISGLELFYLGFYATLILAGLRLGVSAHVTTRLPGAVAAEQATAALRQLGPMCKNSNQQL